MYWLLEMTSARPRATCRPASVTMNGSSRKRVEITPCDGAERGAAGDDGRAASGPGPSRRVVMIVAVSTLERLSSAPTERSMPAVMMTKVMPTAMMPVSETARTMLAMLSGARNRMRPCRRGEKMTPPIATSDQADDALKAHRDRERIERGAGRRRRDRERLSGVALISDIGRPRSLSAAPPARRARRRRRRIPRPCVPRAARRCDRRGRAVPAFRSRRPARRALAPASSRTRA